MTTRKSTLLTITTLFVLVLSNSQAANVSIVRDNSNHEIHNAADNNYTHNTSSEAAYTGSMKVHIVELVSRWKDDAGLEYENAHLSYAILNDLNIPDATIWDTTMTWDGSTRNCSDVTLDNIGAVVAVFNDVDVVSDAYPPNGYMYIAHHNDASAMAYPFSPGKNETAPDFTHTVFVEEGTATW